jgi:hypothetical protein
MTEINAEHARQSIFILPKHRHSTAILTCDETKKHLENVRHQRQHQSRTNIDECLRLQSIHKNIFDRQYQTSVNETISPVCSTNFSHAISNLAHEQRKTSTTSFHLVPRTDYVSLIRERRLAASNKQRIQNTCLPSPILVDEAKQTYVQTKMYNRILLTSCVVLVVQSYRRWKRHINDL